MGNSPTNKKRRIEDETNERDERRESNSGNGEGAEQNGVEIIIYTDPWDVTGWGNEPDLRRLQEKFGHNLTVKYDFLRARTIEKWESNTEMPTVDDPDLPESTKKSYQALKAAQEQGLEREYLRRLRIAALSEGRNIESEDILIKLAAEIGLDTDQLREDIANVEVEDLESVKKVPQMEVTIAGIPHDWAGNIEFERVFGRIVGENVQPDPTERIIPQFVSTYEPVATAEVAETFELNRSDAVEELRQRKEIAPRDFGVGTYWFAR